MYTTLFLDYLKPEEIYITALNYTDNKFYPHIAVYEKCTFGEVGGNRRQRGLKYFLIDDKN